MKALTRRLLTGLLLTLALPVMAQMWEATRIGNQQWELVSDDGKHISWHQSEAEAVEKGQAWSMAHGARSFQTRHTGTKWDSTARAQMSIVGETPVSISGLTSGNELSRLNDAYDNTEPAAGNRIYADLTVNFEQAKIPSEFQNALFIRTKDADRDSTGAAVVSVTLGSTAFICVWHSDAIATKPTWISSDGYSDHNVDIAATTSLIGADFSAYCAEKSGTVDFDGNTTDGDNSFPMYFVTIQNLSFEPPAGNAPGSGNGEYSFVVSSYQVNESTTSVVARVIRSNGSTGAVTVDVTEGGGSTCTTEDTWTDPTTISWADGVDGDGGGVEFTAGALSSSCTVDMEFTNATGGISAGSSNQTTTVTILDVPAVTTDFWVSKTGSDSNTCVQAQTESTAKLTIAAGISCLSSGEVLTVKAGTYAETNLGNAIPFGTIDDYTTIRANTGDTVIVQPSPGAGSRAFFFGGSNVVRNEFVEIDGIDCDGQSTIGQCLKLEGPVNYIRVKNVDWHHTAGSVVLTVNLTNLGWTEATGHHEFLDSDIHHGGMDCTSGNLPQDYGFYMAHDNSRIARNNIYSNNGYGVQYYDSVGSPSGGIVERNFMWDNGDDLCGSNKHGAIYLGGTGLIARNNVMYDNVTSCVDMAGSGGHKFYNNTCTETRGGAWAGGIYLISNGNIARNNIIYETAVTAIVTNGRTLTASNNLTTNPNFVNPGANNYNVQAGSNAIDAGTDLSPDVLVDIEGTSRPQNSVFDIGAYEQ